MPYFSETSKKHLKTCHPDLQRLFEEVIRHYDCSILCGFRDKKEQNKAYEEGNSTKQWPDSRHNTEPSDAVDAVPYPIEWDNWKRFYHFSGFVKGVAAKMGIRIRWGGDWDMDTDFDDQTFNDFPHFELER